MSSVLVFERNGYCVEWQKGDGRSPHGFFVLLGETYRRQYAGNAQGKAKAIAACKRKGGPERRSNLCQPDKGNPHA